MQKTSDLLLHTDFDGAFTPGTVFLMGERECRMETAKRGTLVVPSSQIVANDALAGLSRAKPLKRKVPPGKYPVTIAWNSSETCAMMVRFSRRKAARWEPAVRIGEKLSSSSEVNPPCFGVDSGTAAFFDSKAAKIAGGDENWHNRFTTVYASQYAIEIDQHSGSNLVWCHAGYGDGAYPCYWGLDRSDNVVCLVADFLVLVEGIYQEHEITDLYDKIGSELADPWFSQFDCTDVRLTWSNKTKEFRFEYRCGRSLFHEVTLLSGRGKVVWRGGKDGSHGIPGEPNCIQFLSRIFDVSKDKKAKLVIKRFVGMRALPRKS